MASTRIVFPARMNRLVISKIRPRTAESQNTERRNTSRTLRLAAAGQVTYLERTQAIH